MSRVDDKNEERRAEEARAAERRSQERLQKERRTQITAFDRALAAKAPRSPAPPAQGGSGSSGFRKALLQDLQEAPPPEGRALAEQAESSGAASSMAPEGAKAPLQQGSQAPPSSTADGAPPHPRWRDRSPPPPPDKYRDASARRIDAETRRAEVREEGRQRAAPGVARREEDGGEGDAGGRGDSEKDDQGEQRMAAFKLPPAALMPPPPLARPRAESGAGLGGAAREIVEKIVQRVLVGTNEQGVPEFRLELKSSVLQGLSIRVSASRGKRVRAVFSGADRGVLASLEEASQELKDALAARGLVLEELLFEESKTR